MPVPSEGVGCLLSESAGPPRRTITVCGTELVVWPRTMNLCGGRLQGRVKIGSISHLNEEASVLRISNDAESSQFCFELLHG